MKTFFTLLLLFTSQYFSHAQEVATLAVKTEYSILENIQYRDAKIAAQTDYMKERCVLDIYYPTNRSNFQTVVWFHGGGIEYGNKFFPEELQNKDIAIVAVNYRLFPKVKAPDYIDDSAAAVAWVFQNIQKYGGDPDQIFVSGHSAGGYLTSMIGLDKKYLKKYGQDANKIAALVPYSGHTITHFTVRKERGIAGTQPIIDDLAPLFHIRKDAPPLILITGDRELEMLGRYEENAYLWRMMQVIEHPATDIYELDGYNHGDMAIPAHHILLTTMKKFSNKKKE